MCVCVFLFCAVEEIKQRPLFFFFFVYNFHEKNSSWKRHEKEEDCTSQSIPHYLFLLLPLRRALVFFFFIFPSSFPVSLAPFYIAFVPSSYYCSVLFSSWKKKKKKKLLFSHFSFLSWWVGDWGLAYRSIVIKDKDELASSPFSYLRHPHSHLYFGKKKKKNTEKKVKKEKIIKIYLKCVMI